MMVCLVSCLNWGTRAQGLRHISSLFDVMFVSYLSWGTRTQGQRHTSSLYDVMFGVLPELGYQNKRSETHKQSL